jgi:hypothetical protein
MKLTQLEWIKSELEQRNYEFLELFSTYNRVIQVNNFKLSFMAKQRNNFIPKNDFQWFIYKVSI